MSDFHKSDSVSKISTNSIDLPIILIDFNGIIFDSNSDFDNVFDYRPNHNKSIFSYVGIQFKDFLKKWLYCIVHKVSPERNVFAFNTRNMNNQFFVLNTNKNREGQKLLCIFSPFIENKNEVSILDNWRAKTQLILDSINEAILITDRRSRIVEVNHLAEKYFGYTLSELQGKPIELLIPDRFRSEHIKQRNNYLSNPLRREMGIGLELSAKHKDGSEFNVEVSLNKIEIANETNIVVGVKDITKRKQEYASLLESEERFFSAFEYAPIGMALVSLAGKWIKVNRSVCNIVGYLEEELLQLTFQDITHPEDLESDMQYVNQMLARKIDTYQMEKRYINKKGEIIWVLLSVSLVLSTNNLPLYFISQLQDITSFKAMHADLVQTKERFKLIKSGTALGVWEWNRKKRLEYISDQVYKLLGIDPSKTQLTLFGIIRKIHQEYRKELKDALLQHIKYGVPFSKELLIESANNSFRWFSVAGKMIFNEFGKSERFVGYLIDINQKKQAVERFKQIYQHSAFGMYRTTKEGQIIMANPSLIRLLGYDSLSDLQKRNLSSSGFKKQNIRKKFLKLIHEKGRVDDLESIWIRKDGTEVLIRECAILTDVPEEDRQVIDGTIEDISAKKLIEDERIARIAAENSNKTKSTFLANMSHEIRTPLNSIIGFSDMLHASVEEPKLKSQLKSINQSGKSLLAIVNDILDVSKIEAGKIELQLEPNNLITLIDELNIVFTQKAKEKEITFYYKVNTALPTMLLIDVYRLRQVLNNLIGNAIKFTKKGHVGLLVNTKNKKKDKLDLSIQIKDTGIGIPKEDQRSIFEPFIQREGQLQREYSGTGLGLSISKRLVELMGGTITLDSVVGQGSIFKIVLPAIEISKSELPENKDTTNAHSVIFEHKHVLIVDDNKQNRHLLRDYLEEVNLKVSEAANGQEAIDMIKYHYPDLILMDLLMPKMDGFKATTEIRKLLKTKTMPIIAITASVNTLNMPSSENKIFEEHLEKPLVLNKLCEILKKHFKFWLKEPCIKKIPEFPDNYTIKEKPSKLSEALINQLSLVLNPLYQDAIENQLIDEIEEFGRKIKELGTINQLSNLQRFGHDIISLCANFEIEELMRVLKKFPKIIYDMQKQINEID